MCIYFKNSSAKFHSDAIWSDRALGYLKSFALQRTTRRRTPRWVAVYNIGNWSGNKIGTFLWTTVCTNDVRGVFGTIHLV